MNEEDLKRQIQEIVKQAAELKNKHTEEKKSPVNYACIFAQTKKQYDELFEASLKIGKIIKETPTGFLFHIKSLKTVSGALHLLKIRLPDSTRPEQGDADFTVSNYHGFKKKYLSRKGFKLIQKEEFEMIELMDPQFGVRVYFSHPPLDEQLGIR